MNFQRNKGTKNNKMFKYTWVRYNILLLIEITGQIK